MKEQILSSSKLASDNFSFIGVVFLFRPTGSTKEHLLQKVFNAS